MNDTNNVQNTNVVNSDVGTNTPAAPVVNPTPTQVETPAASVVNPTPVPVETPAASVVNPTPAPVETPAAPVVNPTPAPVETPAAPVVNPTPAPVETPVAPVVNPTPTPVETPAAPVVNPTSVPVETPAAPVVNPTPAPVETPAPAANPAPQAIDPNLVINTKKKETSNTLLFIIIIIIGIGVFFIDDILGYFNVTYKPVLNTSTGDESSNLIDGFIKINENNSFIKLSKIKFYNFKKNGAKTIIFNYTSEKNYTNVSSLNLYIELYDVDKDLIYRELFNPKKTVNTEISLYKLELDNDVYQSAIYSKVVAFDEKNSKTETLVCSYTLKNDDVDLIYKTSYQLKDGTLISYKVDKQYTVLVEDANDEVYKEEIKNEYLKINDYNIKSEYADNKLIYDIDLKNLTNGFIPIYSYGTTKKTIINKEKLKKWECK